MSRDILRFTFRIVVMTLPVLGFAWFTFLQADGRTDPFYLRFTTPKQSSLIIGSSRAAQGILPHIIDSVLGREGLFNYAMTLGNSPYGEVYNESIDKKLDKNARGGLFILDVSPFNLIQDTTLLHSSSPFPEANNPKCNPWTTGMNPNIFYLTKYHTEPYYKIFNPDSTPLFLHDNGWLEVSVKMSPAICADRLQTKIQYYRETTQNWVISQDRLEALDVLISKLKKHGVVYLVRIPVSQEFLELEAKVVPGFNERMLDLSRRHQTPFFDFTHESSQYTYTDGNHLWKESGRQFSIDLAKAIAAAP